MASVLQVGTAVGFNNTATAAVSLTGVTAGSSILIYCPLYSDSTPAEPSATGYTLARRGSITNGSSSRSASFLYAHNVSAGTHNITVSTSAASGFRYGYAIPFEVSGLVNAAPNVTMPASNGANGANDAAPTTGTSGATTAANCFVVAGMCLAANTADAGIDVPATTGYTNHGVRQISTSEVAYSFDSKSVTSTGTQSAAWGSLLASAEWAAVLVAFEANATATVSITATSSSAPVQGSSLTITCTGAGASQGTRDVRIGGVVQTVTSWSDTSITVTVVRGTNKFGAAVNVEVFNSGSLDSNSFSLTGGLQPVSGWDFIDIVSPAANLSTRLSSRPDLVAGDQISWDTRGGLVDVSSDATWSADPQVLSFDFEVWNTGSGWGLLGTQVLYSAQVLDGRADAEIRLARHRMRRSAQRLLDVRTWGGAPLDTRKWFADELEVGAASTSHDTTGALTGQAATLAGSAAHLTLHATSGALAAGSATIAGAALHPRIATGSLTAGSATLAGSALHPRVASGSLSASAATLAGVALHPRVATGALSADAATLAGSATLTPFSGASHSTSGALAADSATLTGSATHLTLHTNTGALAVQSATLAGTAVHFTLHATSGALTAGAAALASVAAHEHATAGALTAAAATISGAADHLAAGTRTASGSLAAGDAIVTGDATLTPRKRGGGGRARKDRLWLTNMLQRMQSAGSMVAGAATVAGQAERVAAVVAPPVVVHDAAGDLVAGEAVVQVVGGRLIVRAGLMRHTEPAELKRPRIDELEARVRRLEALLAATERQT